MSTEILDALRAMHPERRGWLFLPELRLGTGYGGLKEKRLDAWAISCWDNGAPNLRRAFEIKVSAKDLRRELLNPDKRWAGYTVSHEFYFVAPTGLVKLDQLGPEDGLIEWDGTALSIVRKAAVRVPQPPRWDFIAALARRVVAMPVGQIPDEFEPDASDGCDSEGFPGGCERQGHSPATCPQLAVPDTGLTSTRSGPQPMITLDTTPPPGIGRAEHYAVLGLDLCRSAAAAAITELDCGEQVFALMLRQPDATAHYRIGESADICSPPAVRVGNLLCRLAPAVAPRSAMTTGLRHLAVRLTGEEMPLKP